MLVFPTTKMLLLLLIAALFTVALSSDENNCHLKPHRGVGKDFSQKFYFDSDWNHCFGLKYGGQGGNSNRFDSFKECLKCRYLDGSACGVPFGNPPRAHDYGSCDDETMCPKGSTCRYGMYVECCNSTMDAWGSSRYDATCPNGEAASVETVARTCLDLICEKGSKCVQVNPLFARCCGGKKRGDGIAK
uniref:BPTI/Kunitz inhibitor domain-containing protein n=1 Tax=Steinernema glaseri TaxID=37863 RepID=A0A1I8ARS3_9BILA